MRYPIVRLLTAVPLSLALFALAGRTALADALKPAAPSTRPAPFELKDGDRVVFVGGTFFEREGQLGYIETALTSRFPDRNVTFRNLGYAGDTVTCDARNLCAGWATFGPPDQGFNRLKALIEEIKPTVIFVGYGMTESFDGEAKLPEFEKNYERLLDMLSTAAGGSPRFVLVSPNDHENMGPPLPDPAEHNRLLKLYSDAIGQIAQRRGAYFVDLFDTLRRPQPIKSSEAYTEDGLHLSPGGYAAAARSIVATLSGTTQPLDPHKLEQLRQAIVAKNADYFRYWRAENDTYILGYRKHEQGRNAVELPQWKPLAEAKDAEIAKIRASLRPSR